ncbi:MAG TPA: TetR/AcrR family transcriptional regulator [Polyangiaceae bacterium]|nr:TetR/AcrR family transcriptional regulator [Polyangiaceae bacterium]
MTAPKKTREAPEEGLRERNKRDKRERLRAAAWELFTTIGYEATTTRAIAERAGIAAGTVFLYAKDKPDLLFLVFEERLARVTDEAFRTLPRGLSFTEEILHVFRSVFVMYSESVDVGRQFVKELPGADGPNAERVNALTVVFLQRVAALVEKAMERGEIRRDVAPLLAAQAIFALYFMALLSWLAGFANLEGAFDATLAPSLELLMNGMRPAADVTASRTGAKGRRR